MLRTETQSWWGLNAEASLGHQNQEPGFVLLFAQPHADV